MRETASLFVSEMTTVTVVVVLLSLKRVAKITCGARALFVR